MDNFIVIDYANPSFLKISLKGDIDKKAVSFIKKMTSIYLTDDVLTFDIDISDVSSLSSAARNLFAKWESMFNESGRQIVFTGA